MVNTIFNYFLDWERTPRIAIGIMILVLLLSGSADAATLNVCKSGCTYSVIQDAINASSSEDTILVESGTYSEKVNINKKLILRGIGNPVVDAERRGSAITLSADGTVVEGFTATGGEGGYRYETPGAGIWINSNNNMLNGNDASNNGFYGIFLNSSGNNTISGNTVSDNGFYGIFLNSSRDNIINDNILLNNYGEGMYLYDSRNNTLKGNNASNNWDGITLSYSGSNTLNGNYVLNNSIKGISLSDSGSNMLRQNMMTGNQQNFDIFGDNDSDFENNIDTGNLVDGGSIYYIIKASDTTYDSSINPGTFYCISCVNVTIENLNFNKNSKGIFFWNTSQSKIQNVSASKNWNGIYLSSSNNNTIKSNNVSSNDDCGILLKDSSNYNMLDDNKVYSNTQRGISLEDSSNYNNLSRNKAFDNFIGILVSISNNNAIDGNNAYKNYIGISLSSSSKNTMIGNIMDENQQNFDLYGDNESDFDNNIDKGNLVDSKPIYYIMRTSDTTYDSSTDAGTLYCISCVNVTIENLRLNKNGKGIYFWNTSQSKVQYVSVSNNSYGISLISSSKNTLTGNNASSNYYAGIELSSSGNNILNGNNVISNENTGIFLYNSSGNTLIRNNVNSNKVLFGIYLSSSSNNMMIENDVSNNLNGIILGDSSGNMMIGNNVSNNKIGLDLSSSGNNTMSGNNIKFNGWNGISMFSSSNNKLANNNIFSNSHDGILMFSSNNNTVTGNNASSNSNGIDLYDSINNTIYNNYFRNTNNAIDNGNNIWNIPKTSGINIINRAFLGGNFWSDYKGKDTDEDGLGDTKLPYNSSGGIENGGDNLPLIAAKSPDIFTVNIIISGIPVIGHSTSKILKVEYTNFVSQEPYNISVKDPNGTRVYYDSGNLKKKNLQVIPIKWKPGSRGNHTIEAWGSGMINSTPVYIYDIEIVSPVPELGTVILVAAGIIGLIGIRRRN